MFSTLLSVCAHSYEIETESNYSWSGGADTCYRWSSKVRRFIVLIPKNLIEVKKWRNIFKVLDEQQHTEKLPSSGFHDPQTGPLSVKHKRLYAKNTMRLCHFQSQSATFMTHNAVPSPQLVRHFGSDVTSCDEKSFSRLCAHVRRGYSVLEQSIRAHEAHHSLFWYMQSWIYTIIQHVIA